MIYISSSRNLLARNFGKIIIKTNLMLMVFDANAKSIQICFSCNTAIIIWPLYPFLNLSHKLKPMKSAVILRNYISFFSSDDWVKQWKSKLVAKHEKNVIPVVTICAWNFNSLMNSINEFFGCCDSLRVSFRGNQFLETQNLLS